MTRGKRFFLVTPSGVEEAILPWVYGMVADKFRNLWLLSWLTRSYRLGRRSPSLLFISTVDWKIVVL